MNTKQQILIAVGVGLALVVASVLSGALYVVSETEQVIITQFGKLIRMNLNRLRAIGRVTQGVKLIQMDDGEYVVAVTKIEDSDDVNGNGGVSGNGSGNSAGGADGDGPGEPLN